MVDVDVPLHDDAMSLWLAIAGQHLSMYTNGGLPTLPRGRFDIGASEMYMNSVDRGLLRHSPTNTANVILAEWINKEYGALCYAKGTELARIMKHEYEKVMEDNDLDVLIYPTIKFTAPELPDENCSATVCMQHAFQMGANTLPSSLTGHPTLSIPVGFDNNGMPIGMSIVAKDHEDAKCIHVAKVYERLSA